MIPGLREVEIMLHIDLQRSAGISVAQGDKGFETETPGKDRQGGKKQKKSKVNDNA